MYHTPQWHGGKRLLLCECVAALFGKGDIRARMKERERGTLPLGEREAVSAIPPPPSFLRGKKGKRGAEGGYGMWN